MKDKETISYKIFLKSGKPFLRLCDFCGKDLHLDMKIWKADTDKPYCKHMSGLLGPLYLEDSMLKDLRCLQSQR